MANAQQRSVQSWVDALPGSYASDNNPTSLSRPSRQALPSSPNKRKAGHSRITQQASPPVSHPEMETTPTRKRRREVDAAVAAEFDLTPRPRFKNAPKTASASASQSGPSSRSSSPRKQLQKLSLDDTGLEVRTLNINSPPMPAAGDLLKALYETGRGHDILPEDERDRIFQASIQLQSPMDASIWRYSFRPTEADAAPLPGWIPSPATVALVCKRAVKCHDLGHEEAAWNAEVHFRLLESVFRGLQRPRNRQRRPPGLFNMVSSFFLSDAPRF